MPWIAAGASVLGSLGSSMSAKKKAKTDFKNSKELTTLEAALQRQNSQFNKEQDYYYNQLDRKQKSRGLDEFRKFGSVKKWAPTYVNDNAAPVVPPKPTHNGAAPSALPAASPSFNPRNLTGMNV